MAVQVTKPGADVAAAFVPPGGSPPAAAEGSVESIDLGAEGGQDGVVGVEDAASKFVLDAVEDDSGNAEEDDFFRSAFGAKAPVVTPAAQTPTQVPVGAPVEPAPAAPVVPQAVAQPAVAQPPAAAQPQQVAQPAQPAPVAQAPAAADAGDAFSTIREALAKNEAPFLEQLAQTTYQVSQADVDALLSGDGKVVSKAMARVHMNAVSSVMAVMTQQLPTYVQAAISQLRTREEMENGFWTANPHLNKAAHRQYLPGIIKAYASTNPNADTSTIYRVVGAVLAAQLGLPIQAPQAPANGNGQHPTAPAFRTPGPQVRTVAQPGHSPAGVNSNTPHQAPAGTQWERMYEAIHGEDMGNFEVR